MSAGREISNVMIHGVLVASSNVLRSRATTRINDAGARRGACRHTRLLASPLVQAFPIARPVVAVVLEVIVAAAEAEARHCYRTLVLWYEPVLTRR